jgi:hypothetical protein
VERKHSTRSTGLKLKKRKALAACIIISIWKAFLTEEVSEQHQYVRNWTPNITGTKQSILRT